MKYTEVMAQLEAMGTEQNRKVYARHGVLGKMFGVSFANLHKLKKQIRADHALATELWASGNHDARVLATMVADPKSAEPELIDQWAKSLDSYVLADVFSGYVAKTGYARTMMTEWLLSEREYTGQAGWNIVAHVAMKEEDLSDEEMVTLIEQIEENIHRSKNRVRHAMNNALIAIGMRSGGLQQAATAAARRIGAVRVDHGETGCITPDAVAYIEKAREHKEKREKLRKERARPKKKAQTFPIKVRERKPIVVKPKAKAKTRAKPKTKAKARTKAKAKAKPRAKAKPKAKKKSARNGRK